MCETARAAVRALTPRTADLTTCGGLEDAKRLRTGTLNLTLNLKPQCPDPFGGHNRNHVSGHTGLETKPTWNVESNNFRTFQALSWARGRQQIRGRRFSVNF